MTLGTKIRVLRNMKEWSQENMAEMLGITVQAFSKIERDKTDVNHSRLEQIAEVLKIELADLLKFGENGIFINQNSRDVFTNTGNVYTQENQDLQTELIALRTENAALKSENEHLRSLVQQLLPK
jgi:transcriptional regulator with XRE-family HTH domain